MVETLFILVHTLAAVLRKLWQKLTGRVPVPVPVRVRRSPYYRFDTGGLLSRTSVNGHSSSALDEIRRSRW